MIFIKISTLLVVFALEYSLASAILSSELTITYEDGNTFTYTSAQPQLLTSGITNICIQGAWVAYSDRNFVSKRNMSVFLPVKKRCPKLTDLVYHGSVRPVGNTSNIAAPSINFYTEKDLGGFELLVTSEVSYLDFDIQSFVTLNGVSVEYFTGPNFTGTSICVESTGNGCSDGNCNVYDLEDNTLINRHVATQISNAKSIRITNCSNRDNTVKLN